MNTNSGFGRTVAGAMLVGSGIVLFFGFAQHDRSPGYDLLAITAIFVCSALALGYFAWRANRADSREPRNPPAGSPPDDPWR